MSNKVTSKGSAMLASVLQERMAQVSDRHVPVSVETGEILSGYKLKLSSIPGAILDKDDYSVCSTIQQKLPCQKKFPIRPGDKVLIVWTYDGEPVVIDKLYEADHEKARVELDWQKYCEHCEDCKNCICKKEE